MTQITFYNTFKGWGDALVAKFGNDYEMFAGINSIGIRINGEHVAGFNHITGKGWIQ